MILTRDPERHRDDRRAVEAIASDWPPIWHDGPSPASVMYSGARREFVREGDRLTLRSVPGQARGLAIYGGLWMTFIAGIAGYFIWTGDAVAGPLPKWLLVAGFAFCGWAAVAIMAAIVKHEERSGPYVEIDEQDVRFPRTEVTIDRRRVLALQVLTGHSGDRGSSDIHTHVSLLVVEESDAGDTPRVLRHLVMGDQTAKAVRDEVTALADALAVPSFESRCPAGYTLRSDATG